MAVIKYGHLHKAQELINDMRHQTGETSHDDLQERMETVQQLMQRHRACRFADRHFMHDVSMRDIAREKDLQVGAISYLIRTHGPKQYLSLREEKGNIVPEWIRNGLVLDVLKIGRRVVPSVWGLEPDVTLGGPELLSLWHELASQPETAERK